MGDPGLTESPVGRTASALFMILMVSSAGLADTPDTQPSSVVTQARVVRGVSVQPAMRPEQWVIDAIKALPVNVRNNEKPPQFVESVMEWLPISLDKPTTFDVRGMRVTTTVKRDAPLLTIGLLLESGNARAPSRLVLDAAPGSRRAMQVSSNLDGERGYLVVQVLAAAATQPAAASAPASQESPDGAWIKLCADETWYKDQPGKEEIFSGKLQAVPGADEPSTLQRAAYYRLGTRTVFTGAKKVDALDKLVGRNVQVRGKAYDDDLEGHAISEIWPASVRINTAGKPTSEPASAPR